jgi:hypothetical protein
MEPWGPSRVNVYLFIYGSITLELHMGTSTSGIGTATGTRGAFQVDVRCRPTDAHYGFGTIPVGGICGSHHRTQEWKFQAIEQRACEEEVMQRGIPPRPDSLLGATLAVRSHTVISVYNRSVIAETHPKQQCYCCAGWQKRYRRGLIWI